MERGFQAISEVGENTTLEINCLSLSWKNGAEIK